MEMEVIMTSPIQIQSEQKFLRSIPWEAFVNIATIVACTVYLVGEIRQCNERTDKLYELYVENQANLTDMQRNIDQKFYDILKESKK